MRWPTVVLNPGISAQRVGRNQIGLGLNIAHPYELKLLPKIWLLAPVQLFCRRRLSGPTSKHLPLFTETSDWKCVSFQGVLGFVQYHRWFSPSLCRSPARA